MDVVTFEKPLVENRILRNIFDYFEKMALRRGAAMNYYELVDRATGEVELFKDWEWADVDGGRILWAEAGKIFSANVEAKALGPAKMLYDFNDMTFQEIEAPY